VFATDVREFHYADRAARCHIEMRWLTELTGQRDDRSVSPEDFGII